MDAGALISIMTFLKPIIVDLGWLRGETSMDYKVSFIAMGFGGILMGYLSDRHSTRPVIVFGVHRGIRILGAVQRHGLGGGVAIGGALCW